MEEKEEGNICLLFARKEGIVVVKKKKSVDMQKLIKFVKQVFGKQGTSLNNSVWSIE
jgi:hypothetical protein